MTEAIEGALFWLYDMMSISFSCPFTVRMRGEIRKRHLCQLAAMQMSSEHLRFGGYLG